MSRARPNYAAVVISPVASIVAGILGSWLTGEWSWGIILGLLCMITLVAGAEVVKAGAEREGDQKESLEPKQAVSGAHFEIGGDFYPANSVVVGRDISHTTNINSRKGSSVALVAVSLCALLSGTGGTVYFWHEHDLPHLQPTSPASHAAGSSRTATPQPSTSMSVGNGTQWAGLHLAATFNETDSSGDSITQAVWFSTPLPLSQLPSVAAAQNACSLSQITVPLGRDLVVPFAIATRLNSSIAVEATVGLTINDFFNSSSGDDGLLQNGPAVVLGRFQNGILCDDASSGDGGTVTLSGEGDEDVFKGWIIFVNAITADNPHGNISVLGQTYAQLDIGPGSKSPADAIRVSGPGVCVKTATYASNGNINLNADSPPYIHIGGPESTWEGCSGYYSGQV